VTGQHGWEHLQSNPQTQTIFNQAMRDLSASISPARNVPRLDRNG
jgi:hypothetical protein